jgi:hypothetical protein
MLVCGWQLEVLWVHFQPGLGMTYLMRHAAGKSGLNSAILAHAGEWQVAGGTLVAIKPS